MRCLLLPLLPRVSDGGDDGDGRKAVLACFRIVFDDFRRRGEEEFARILRVEHLYWGPQLLPRVKVCIVLVSQHHRNNVAFRLGLQREGNGWGRIRIYSAVTVCRSVVRVGLSKPGHSIGWMWKPPGYIINWYCAVCRSVQTWDGVKEERKSIYKKRGLSIHQHHLPCVSYGQLCKVEGCLTAMIACVRSVSSSMAAAGCKSRHASATVNLITIN